MENKNLNFFGAGNSLYARYLGTNKRVGWSWPFLDCINIVEEIAENKVFKAKIMDFSFLNKSI